MSRRIGLLFVALSCACVLSSNAQSVVASITIPNNPEGIAVNPANNRIYVSIGGPSVVVIDGATNTVIDTISVSQGAGFIAANLVTGRVYTAGCNSSQTPACGVTVIDGTSNAIIATIPVAGTSGIGVQGIAVDPVTNRIYVADDDNYQVEVIDGYTNTALGYINTHNAETLALAVDFVTGQIVGVPSGDVIDVINGANKKVTQILVGPGGLNQSAAVNSFTGRVYVTNQGTSNNLPVVSLATQKVTGNVALSAPPFADCVDYISNVIFVTLDNGNVAVVNGSTNTVKATVTVVGSGYIDVNPVTKLAYTAGLDYNTGTYVVNVISE